MTSPHAYLSTATGLAFAARAIGGAFGSATLNAIIEGRLAANYGPAVTEAALAAGLPASSIEGLLKALALGKIGDASVSGATPEIWAAAVAESQTQFAAAYRLAWASIIPFVVLATVAVGLLRGVSDLMTEKIEATVEHVEGKKGEGASA